MEKGTKEAADRFERNIKLAEQGDAEAQFKICWEYESRLESEKATYELDLFIGTK